MEYDIHTVLDAMTLVATIWVIYELRGPLKSTYQAEQDNLQSYFVVCGYPLPLNDLSQPKTHGLQVMPKVTNNLAAKISNVPCRRCLALSLPSLPTHRLIIH